jgi:hypothetical protein
MEPETSGQTTTSPAIDGTFATASSIASCKAFLQPSNCFACKIGRDASKLT